MSYMICKLQKLAQSLFTDISSVDDGLGPTGKPVMSHGPWLKESDQLRSSLQSSELQTGPSSTSSVHNLQQLSSLLRLTG
ncbi:hypothetical protein MJO29_011943 [Puccinia striiformis f. sp. tritici]|nr:hypothetical protein MJO29_011943 [Puccinia striiformis f. sp. tritici]